jgi:hypothetical protein
MKGQLYFTGLAVYYLLYVDVGAGGAEASEAEKAETDKFIARPTSTSRVFEKKGTCVLLQPWQWPST